MSSLIKRIQAAFWLAALVTLVCNVAPASAQMPTPPFTQCPAVGLDTSCRLLIVITASGSQVLLTDNSVSPTYDGNDDTLVGILNLSSKPVSSIPLTSDTDIFGFDGDGICAYLGCSYGPSGYEGPGVSFANINAAQTSGTVNFSPALTAKGGTTYFGLENNLPTQCTDADGDGLCDDWELYGLTVYVNGLPVFVDLPSMGADPNHKDIFVQADYMVEPGVCLPMVGCMGSHTHKPMASAIALMTQAYQNSPVMNPDGTTGVHLHVDCGSDCIMNPITNQTWGTFSQAAALAHQTTIGSSSGGSYVWSDFDAIKAVNFSPAREQVFHYVVFAHNLGNLDGTSGISRGLPASDLIVSLGSWTNSVGTSMEQGGTFLHELGHNLSLQHGGTDGINFKPNFLSVMNYSFQTTGLVVGGAQGTFDYSRFALPSLDETALNEKVGLNGGAVAAGYGTIRSCPGQTALVFTAVGNGPIDWNCNGTVENLPVAADINQDNLQTTLTSYNDWPNLVFTGGSVGGLGLSLTPPATTPVIQELSPSIDAKIPKPFKVTVSAMGAAQVPPGSAINLSFTVKNLGTDSDIYTLTSNSSTTWANVGGIPAQVSLASGAEKVFTVPVSVPGATALGATDLLSLKAVSTTNPNIFDTGSTTVTTKAATQTTVTVSPTTALRAGQQLTIVATVAPIVGVAIPTGNVVFSSPNGNGIITMPLIGGKATLVRPAPAAGTYTLKATYDGDLNFTGSVSVPVTRAVAK